MIIVQPIGTYSAATAEYLGFGGSLGGVSYLSAPPAAVATGTGSSFLGVIQHMTENGILASSMGMS